MTVLETKNLGVTIGGNDVVCDLNISLEAGRVLGICGESGAGKSMAAMAIAGLLPDDAGRYGQISLASRRLDQCDEKTLSSIRGAEIGMIFQEPLTALNPLLTIGDQVAEVFRQHRNLDRRAALDEAAKTLQLVGLPPAQIPLSRLPDELSGGQRQRVVIAMAIALGPKLLIADEPTTALDATTQAEILDLLQQLVRDENLALLLITHDLGVMARMADDLIVMDGGNVIEAGDVTMLDGGLHHPRAIALAAASRLDAPAKADAAGATAAPLMTLDNVSYHYQGRGYRAAAQQALSDVSFSIDEGEIIGIVGASGSGKTTLSRLMLGLLNPSSGQISSQMHTRPGTVFQDPYASFNPRQRIGRLVAEPFFGVSSPPPVADQRDAVADVLAAVDIDPAWQDRLIHQCSGGQRQRIAFARAMVTHPRLIILDEPVSALDATLRQKVLHLMAERARSHGIACVFISHDLSVVRAVCPRVMVMAGGQIIEDGPTANVFKQPREAVTRTLVEAALDWRQELDKRAAQAG